MLCIISLGVSLCDYLTTTLYFSEPRLLQMSLQSQNLLLKFILRNKSDATLNELSQLVAVYEETLKKSTGRKPASADNRTSVEQELEDSVSTLNVYVQECIFKGPYLFL